MPCQWSCQPSCKMNLPSSTCFITGTKSKDAFFTITHAVWLHRPLDLGNMFTLLQQCQGQPSRCSARSAKQDKAPSRARSGAFLSDKGFNSSCTTCIRQSSWHVTRNLRNQAEALEIDSACSLQNSSYCHPYCWTCLSHRICTSSHRLSMSRDQIQCRHCLPTWSWDAVGSTCASAPNARYAQKRVLRTSEIKNSPRIICHLLEGNAPEPLRRS